MDQASSVDLDDDSYHLRVARLAYHYWERRGRPEGSPEIDWLQAEAVVRHAEALDEPPTVLPHGPGGAPTPGLAGPMRQEEKARRRP